MTGEYRLKIRVWPYQGVDQKLCGDKIQIHRIDAQSFEDAYRQAKLIQRGIKCNPSVWESPIDTLEFVQ